MWRAFLLAIGICMWLVEGQCLVMDRMILADPGSVSGSGSGLDPLDYGLTTPRRVVVPPEWAPWGLLAAGAIAVIYSRSGGAASG